MGLEQPGGDGKGGIEAFDCGSQSTKSVFTSAAAKDAARLMAVVVFPTPPF